MIHTLLDFKNNLLEENKLVAIKFVGTYNTNTLYFIDYTDKIEYLFSTNFYSRVRLIVDGCFLFKVKNTSQLEFVKFIGYKEQSIPQKIELKYLKLNRNPIFVGVQ